MSKRILAMLLAFVLLFAVLPISALATDPCDTQGHAFDDNGYCAVCGKFQSAVKVTADNYTELGLDESYVGYYAMANAGQLYWFAAFINGLDIDGNGRNYTTNISAVLLDDIDLSVNGEPGIWYPIGVYNDPVTDNPATGMDSMRSAQYLGSGKVFDGNHHTVSNFRTTGRNSQGFIGYANYGTIKNLGVINATVSGWNAGAIVGYFFNGTVENCYVLDSTITAATTNTNAKNLSAGAVAGSIYGNVVNCYAANCTVTYGEGMTLPVTLAPIGCQSADNCYYADVAAKNGNFRANSATVEEIEMTKEALASGKAAYLLNGFTSEGDLTWFQTIGKDDHPVFEGKVVYFEESADPQYFNEKQNTEAKGVTRLSGKGRCETAYLAADELKTALDVEKFDAIIIASGDNFADALAGSYLAAVKNAPILLYRNGYADGNAAYIEENLAEDGIIYILGGTAAVPEEMETALDGYTVKRIKGSNRFETNLAILEEAGIGQKDILVATGYNFADSLSASATGMPILLVHNGGTDLTDSQKAFLGKLNGNKIVVIGGEGAVNASLYAALENYGDVERVKGSGREATSVEIAKKYFTNPDAAVVAYSRNFPDGLCGGPLAYALGAPLLLTNTGYETVTAGFTTDKGITDGFVLGGTAAVSDEIVRTVFAMAEDVEITVKR